MTETNKSTPGERFPCWCGELPDAFPDAYLSSVVELAANVEEVDCGRPDNVMWRCLVCGQLWRTPVRGPGVSKLGSPDAVEVGQLESDLG
jgi:hypothetical protein